MTKKSFFWTLLGLSLAMTLTMLVNEFYTFCPTVFGIPITYKKWHELSLGTRFKLAFIIGLFWFGIIEVLIFLGWKFFNKENISYFKWRSI